MRQICIDFSIKILLINHLKKKEILNSFEKKTLIDERQKIHGNE